MSKVSNLTSPVAIAMWDFSWMLRHQPCGGFEDWDRVLDELVDRGYNAIRADMFPQMVAAGPDGVVTEEFHLTNDGWKPVMWGNQYSICVRPREALLEFLPKCRERGVHVGMSTWFFGGHSNTIQGLDGFVRVWDETLSFLDAHGLLENCLYLDLLNEYPLFHGFTWFHEEMKRLGEEYEAPSAHAGGADLGQYNAQQTFFYRNFMHQAIARLAEKWPALDIFTCQTKDPTVAWENMDFTGFSALDVHQWFVNLNDLLARDSGYWQNIHSLADNAREFPKVQSKLMQNWAQYKNGLIAAMDGEMGRVAAKARELGVPCGNTEGWGTVCWLDHPDLTWDIIKESGEICAGLGRKHGYLFNCTSNFTHPQFPRLWHDVGWHREVTAEIRRPFE